MSSLRLALKQSLEAAGKSSKKKSTVSEYEADFLSDRQKLKRKKLLEAEARKDGRRKKKRRKKDLSGTSFSGEVSVSKNPVGRPRKKPLPADYSTVSGGKDESCVVIKKRGPGRPKKIKNRRKDETSDNRIENDGNVASYSMGVPPEKKREFLKGIDGRVPGPTFPTPSQNISADERSSSDNIGGLSSDFEESSVGDVSSQEEESSLRDSSDESDEDENLTVKDQSSSKSEHNLQQNRVKNPDVAARLLQSTWKKKKTTLTKSEGNDESSADVPVQPAILGKPYFFSKDPGNTGSESEASQKKKKKKRLKKLKLMKLKERMRSNDDVDAEERGKIVKKMLDLPSAGMKQRKMKRRPRTVQPPVEEVILAYRKMTDDEKRDYIRIGHRVKVRFDTSDGNVAMKKKERAQYMKWFGGCVSKIYSGALRIRISYDDGTKEIADFPDKEIIIDDGGNGHHNISDDDGDDEEEEFVGSPLLRGKQNPDNFENSAKGEEGGKNVLEQANKPSSAFICDSSLNPSAISSQQSLSLSRITSFANDKFVEGTSMREEDDFSPKPLSKSPEVKTVADEFTDSQIGKMKSSPTKNEPKEENNFMKRKDKACDEVSGNAKVESCPSSLKQNSRMATNTSITALSVKLPKKSGMIRPSKADSSIDGCKDDVNASNGDDVSQAKQSSDSAFRAIQVTASLKTKLADLTPSSEKVDASDMISKVTKADDLFAPIVKKQSAAMSPRPRSSSPIPRRKKRENSPARSKSPVLLNPNATNDDTQGNVRSGRAAARAANERIKARQEKFIQDTPQKGRRRGKRPKHRQMSDSDDDGSGGEGVWVQCDECQKWRLLPSFVNSAALPDKWFCSMNIYDNYNSCNVPEQILPNSVDIHGPLKEGGVVKGEPMATPIEREEEFVDKEIVTDPIRRQPKRRALNVGGESVDGKKGRSRRLGGINNKGKKTSHQEEQEWVQCENCEKWRRLPSDGSVKSDSLPDAWFCNMNTWNPKEASCFMDEENYNEKAYITIMGIGASTNKNSSSSSKLSYRNLIFGTGRKSSRPYSDRARADDSLFAIQGENGHSLLYANCNSYTPGRRYIGERKEDAGRLFRVLRKTSLWRELKGIECESVDNGKKKMVSTSKPLKKRINKVNEGDGSSPFA